MDDPTLCRECGTALAPHSRVCEVCGKAVAAAGDFRIEASGLPPQPVRLKARTKNRMPVTIGSGAMFRFLGLVCVILLGLMIGSPAQAINPVFAQAAPTASRTPPFARTAPTTTTAPPVTRIAPTTTTTPQIGQMTVPGAMFRANPQHTGVYAGSAPRAANVLWKFETDDTIYSSPTVAGGIVYFGNGSGNFYALDAKTGGKKWTFKAGNAIESSAAVGEGVVYLGSWDGFLYALDAATGQPRWKFKTGGPITSSPVLTDGVVYFGSADAKLYAVDAATGQQKWTCLTGGEVDSSPAVVGSVVVVGSADQYVTGVNARNGQATWKFKTGGAVTSSPAVMGGVVYVGSQDKNLYALDLATGKEKWRFKTGGAVDSSPALDSGQGYGMNILEQGVVVFGSADKSVYALNAQTGQRIWQFMTDDAVSSSPAIASLGTVLVGSLDGQLYALSMASPRPSGLAQWKLALGSGIHSSPAVADGIAFVGSTDGYLYAVGGPGGDAIASEVVAEGQITPENGALVQAGVASVRIPPGAVMKQGQIKVESKSDGSLNVTLDPSQDLVDPAQVTLQMPPGVDLNDASRWPVAVLDPGTDGATVLFPEAIGAGSFTVLVPHFTNVKPILRTDARQQAPRDNIAVSQSLYDPQDMRVEIRLISPEENIAAGGEIEVRIRAKALTSDNNGYPEVGANGKLLDKWQRFEKLRAKIYSMGEGESRKWPLLLPRSADLTLVNGETKGYQRIQLNVLRGPYAIIMVMLETEDGQLLVRRHYGGAPTGINWGYYHCAEHPGTGWLNFRIKYLQDKTQVDYPDRDYTPKNPPEKDGPSRVLDTCEALTVAYQRLNGPTAFNTRAPNAILFPIDVTLWPWGDSQSSNQNPYAWLKLRTRGITTYERFKIEAAHELAHRFQNLYSIGYIDRWFHDASAEYLANWVFGTPNTAVSKFSIPGEASPTWLMAGLESSAPADNNGASAFVAFLVDQYGLNVFRAWTEGATGWGNFHSWVGYLDQQLKDKGGLSKAWERFATAYLIDHSIWGNWEGIDATEMWRSYDRIVLLTSEESKVLRSGKADLFKSLTIHAPCLSAGGTMVYYTGAPAVTIGWEVRSWTPDFGAFPRIGGRLWISSNVNEVDGKALTVRWDQTGVLPHVKGDFRLGQTLGALGNATKARWTYVLSDWESDKCRVGKPMFQVDVRAIPQVGGVNAEKDKLSWEASYFENAEGVGGKRLFDSYEVVQKQGNTFSVIQKLPAQTTSFSLGSAGVAGQGGDVCVRVRDTDGIVGPEGCAIVIQQPADCRKGPYMCWGVPLGSFRSDPRYKFCYDGAAYACSQCCEGLAFSPDRPACEEKCLFGPKQ